jgi:hypothetical protein
MSAAAPAPAVAAEAGGAAAGPLPGAALHATLRVRFASPAHAALGAAVLAVDPELNPDRVAKAITASDADVLASFHAVDMRSMRLSMSAFLDCVGVVLRTLRDFGE